MNARTVLVIEDEAPLRERIIRMLRFEGFEAEGAANGQQGLKIAMTGPPDAILCDILMPVLDGNMLVPILRADPATRLTPIIMLTALSDRATQRRFMEAGADDFLVKPFTSGELFGTLRAQLRKYDARLEHETAKAQRAPAGDAAAASELRIGPWRYDAASRLLAHKVGRRAWLTGAEGQLLQILIEHAGRPVSREIIHAGMKGSEFSPADRSTDILIARLRRKLGDNPREPVLIRTIRNVGYILQG